MDKYEFNLKIEQLKKLIEREDYATALKIVSAIDWNRVRNTNLLTMAATVYEKNDQLQEAKDMLILAFERAPVGKHLLFKLTELSCRTGDLEEAEDYYREFRAADSTDIGNYLLQYMILKARHSPYERQLLPLERYCEADPDEKWLFELATVYENANRIEDCVRTCDRLALLYGASSYGAKAVRLKSRYAAITDSQKNMLYPRSTNASYDSSAAYGSDAGPIASFYGQGSAENVERAANAAYSGAGNAGQDGYQGATQYSDVTEAAGSTSPTGPKLSYTLSAEERMRVVNALNGGQSEQAAETMPRTSGQQSAYTDMDSRQEVGSTGYDENYTHDIPDESAAYDSNAARTAADDFRKSEALAAERYADEDAVFDAYVRAYASDEGRPAAGTVEVVNGTASIVGGRVGTAAESYATGMDDAESPDGVQMAFDFANGEPVVVDEKPEEYMPEGGNDAGAAASIASDAVTGAAAVMAGTTAAATAGVSTAAGTQTPQYNNLVNRPVERPARPVQAPARDESAQQYANSMQAAGQPQSDMQARTATVQVQQTSMPAYGNGQTATASAAAMQRAQAQQQRAVQPVQPQQSQSVQKPYEQLHMIVEARTEAEGLSIAVDELKNIHEEHKIEHASIKTKADKLNVNGITAAIIDKVRGKDFVIENAGALSEINIETIYDFICEDRTGTIVVLIDTPEGLDRIESIRPELFDICDYISDIEDEEEDTAQAVPAAAASAVNAAYAADQADNSSMAKTASAAAASHGREEAYEEADDEGYDESKMTAYDDSDDADGVNAHGRENAGRNENRSDRLRAVSDEDYDEDESETDDEAYDDEDDKKADEEVRTPQKRSNGKVTERFNNVKLIEIDPKDLDREMDIDEFAQFCAQYAASIDCSIPGTSMLALYERIELMEENDIKLTGRAAQELIEEAADRAERPPLGKRLTGMFKSKYDKSGLLILKEDDFIY